MADDKDSVDRSVSRAHDHHEKKRACKEYIDDSSTMREHLDHGSRASKTQVEHSADGRISHPSSIPVRVSQEPQ